MHKKYRDFQFCFLSTSGGISRLRSKSSMLNYIKSLLICVRGTEVASLSLFNIIRSASSSLKIILDEWKQRISSELGGAMLNSSKLLLSRWRVSSKVELVA